MSLTGFGRAVGQGDSGPIAGRVVIETGRERACGGVASLHHIQRACSGHNPLHERLSTAAR